MNNDSLIGISRGNQLLKVQKELSGCRNKYREMIDFEIDDSDISKFIMIYRPPEGLYKGLVIRFQLTVPENYPLPGNQIDIKCLTNIFHPNIFTGGKLCLQLDGMGCYDEGYRESLENLILGVFYLFLHPNNMTSVELDRDNDLKQQIMKNVEDQKKQNMANSDSGKRSIRMKEIYSQNINNSLQKIIDQFPELIDSFPQKYFKIKNNTRFYIVTLGGVRIMDLIKLEEMTQQIFHDHRFIFRFISDNSIMFEHNDYKIEPNEIIFTKMREINHPYQITYDHMTKKYIMVSSYDFFSTGEQVGTNINIRTSSFSIMLFNITIRSNVDFELYMTDLLVIKSKNKVLHIDQILSNMTNFKNRMNSIFQIRLDSTNDFVCDCWFEFEYNVMMFGYLADENLKNIVFKPVIDDEKMTYIKHNDMSNFRSVKIFADVTQSELKFIKNADSTQLQDEELERAKKYIATNVTQTGFNLTF
jgi:ubiquitin-protein ligase